MTKPKIAVKEQPLFFKKKHELAKLLKEIEKGSEESVHLLLTTMRDEKIELKTRILIAESIITMQAKIADQISRDTLSRQIAEIKVNGLSKPLAIDESQRRDIPMIDLNNIREV